MLLTIIIVNYNSGTLLKSCLTSIQKGLQRANFNSEVIVIDNASSKDRININDYSQNNNLTFFFNRKNLGYSRAVNIGISKAQGKYVLLLNPDTVVLNRAIEKLIDFNKSFKGFCGAKLLNKDLTPQSSCGAFFSLINIFFILFLQAERLGITKFVPKNTSQVDWVSGACLLGQKDIFLRIGCFDEKIFLYMEDVDLIYRAKKLGIKCYYLSEAEFIHYGSEETGRKNSVRNIYVGLLYFFKKHNNLISVFLVKILLYLKAYIVISYGFILKDRCLIRDYQKALSALAN